MTNHPANERVLGVRGRKLHFREQRIPHDEPADVSNTKKKSWRKYGIIWWIVSDVISWFRAVVLHPLFPGIDLIHLGSTRKKNSLLFEACKQYSQKRLCRRGTPKKKITVISMLGSNVCISVENRLIKTLLIDTRDEIQKPSIKYIRICMYRSLTDYSTSRIFLERHNVKIC